MTNLSHTAAIAANFVDSTNLEVRLRVSATPIPTLSPTLSPTLTPTLTPTLILSQSVVQTLGSSLAVRAKV